MCMMINKVCVGGCDMENGILEIPPIKSRTVDSQMLILGLLASTGCSVSDMPREVIGDEDYCGRWELMDPEQVERPEDLPDYFQSAYKMHNEPNRVACVDLRYRYIHCPEAIIGRYPSVPARGIFVLTDDEADPCNIPWESLYHIGDELEE
jgi:hypothetical protein